MFDERFVRTWRLYLAGSVAAFRTGTLQLFQVIFARPPAQRDPVDAGASVPVIAPRPELMTACDVLIVGGGPAGSTCAWKLRRPGLDVVVWDRQTFPRDKVCAGWITPQVVDGAAARPGRVRRRRA